MAEAAIELVGINKSFGAVRANQDINLKIEKGTIHGIIGENGAGKSTLMSILYGFYQADSGRILINDKATTIDSPDDAIKQGIGMVHQHFMLVQNFTVIENVILGAEGEALLGRPYDLYFEWSDERVYCSELVWKVYQRALGIKIGALQTISEFDLSHPAVQAKIRERWPGQPPADEQVISPAAMFASDRLVTVYEN